MADASIYHDAWLSNLAIPDDKYFLTDVGFSNCHQLLILYYHGQ